MHALSNKRPGLIVALVAILVLPPARAVDGVVLIDQNRALAGNVTPGDAPGFPVTITQNGSYRLAGNLTPPLGTPVFEVTASDVTLDLNGFSLLAVPHEAGRADVAIALRGEGNPAFTLVNGSIVGFNFPLDPRVPEGPLASSLTLERLTFRNLPNQGPATLFMPPSSVVSGVRGVNCTRQGFCPILVVNSLFLSIPTLGNPAFPKAACVLANNATPL